MKPQLLSESTAKDLLKNMSGEELAFAIVYNKKGEPKLFMPELKETTETPVPPQNFDVQTATQITTFSSQATKTCVLINGIWYCW
ncbi:MAG: hypothetical protein CTY16_06765 [Methylobacter sp.]|nr:MAG: hypothetical protein CTY16_06765 [Methylobacter sp.]